MKDQLLRGIDYFRKIEGEHPAWGKALRSGRPLGGAEFKRVRQHYIDWCKLRRKYDGDDLPAIPLCDRHAVAEPLKITHKFSVTARDGTVLTIGAIKQEPLEDLSIKDVKALGLDCVVTEAEVKRWEAEKQTQDDLLDLMLIRATVSPMAQSISGSAKTMRPFMPESEARVLFDQ